MAEFIADGDSESDIMVTSFSNPNYGLGLRGNPHCGVMAEGGSGVGDPNGNLSMSGGYDASSMSIDDSGDSAISSPVTDSDLTSPGAEEDGGVVSGRHDDICDRMKRAVRMHLMDEMKQSASEAVAMTSDVNSISHSDGSSSSVDTGLGTIPESHTEQSPGTETGITNGTASLPSDGLVQPPASLVLPTGWQRHEDEGGAYYWHIKSGTIQREIPVASPTEQQSQHNKDLPAALTIQSSAPDGSSVAVKQNGTSGGSNAVAGSETPDTGVDYETLAPDTGTFPIRFAVRSLGWVPIAEDQLTQENSSRAVNHCIVGLSSGARDINDVVGRWGDGKYLYMDLDQENLSLIDPHDLTVLNVQPIRSIRVWGVGRDSGRDFAYVARDRVSRRHLCHVFRCELPARHIANTLCEICKKLIALRNTAQAGNVGGAAGGQRSRPTDLPNLHRTSGTSSDQNIKFENLLKNTSFPTPMDEPRKVMSCHFLGTIPVSMATGIEVLNGAIETLHSRVPAENWTYVNVTVAPSTVTISDYKNGDNVIAECRVRFLSFLGISLTNVKLCAFIMHTAQDQFIAYVFYCEPSAGALSKTVEAACKLRYQKCLDKTAPSTTDGLTSPPQSCGGTTKEIDCLELEPTLAAQTNTGGFRSAMLARAGSLRQVVSSSAANIKAGTALKAAALKESAQTHATVLKDGAKLRAASLRESAQVHTSALKDSAHNTSLALKENISVKAGIVRDSAWSTSLALKDSISTKAASVKSGISWTFGSLRKATESYLGASEPAPEVT